MSLESLYLAMFIESAMIYLLLFIAFIGLVILAGLFEGGLTYVMEKFVKKMTDTRDAKFFGYFVRIVIILGMFILAGYLYLSQTATNG